MDFLPEITKIDNKIHFDCGCVVDHQDYAPVINFDNINLECPNTYELLSEGYTGNIFQLDSPVSHTLTKNLKPRSMEDVAELVSISRPGCLRAKFSDGHSMSSHIIMRKHKEEEVTYLHPSLESILKDTEGIIVFQEQCLIIAKIIAGFTDLEANDLRKSIGKKDSALMSSLKQKFIDGCKQVGTVDEEIAKNLFENIAKSASYSFNKCCTSTTLLIFDDNSRDDLGSLYRSGSWKNKKSLSLKISKRLSDIQDRPIKNKFDTLVKNTEVIPNEIVDIRDAGKQLVYRVTLKRRKVRDKRYPKIARPHYSIDVTANHKFPTRCHGEVKVSELIPGIHSLYCYDYNRSYQPRYRHAASRVISVEKLDVQQVYDVEMKAPYHNFLANDIFTCNSHAVGYGKQSYITAWVKTHFPIEFYAANLRLNEERGGKKDKLLDEKAGTIREAKEFGISIIPPRMDFAVSEFDIKDQNTISYGISNIKKTGLKEAELVIEFLRDKKPTWLEILFGLGSSIKSDAFENICGTGFFLGAGGTRNSQIYEFRTYKKFTDKEESWIRDRLSQFSSLEEAIVALLNNFTDTSVKPRERGIARKDRVTKVEDFLKTLREPPHSLEDTPLTINKSEKDLLGVALTYSDVEARSLCGIFTDTTCKEFNDGKRAKSMTIACSIGRVKEHMCKNDKKMAFLSLSSDDGVIESVIAFADVYEQYGNILTDKNTVVVQGVRGDKNTFIINKVVQI